MFGTCRECKTSFSSYALWNENLGKICAKAVERRVAGVEKNEKLWKNKPQKKGAKLKVAAAAEKKKNTANLKADVAA